MGYSKSGWRYQTRRGVVLSARADELPQAARVRIWTDDGGRFWFVYQVGGADVGPFPDVASLVLALLAL